MENLYRSKYYSDLGTFLQTGWTIEEINTYFPYIESLKNTELIRLHQLSGIDMFTPNESLDKEQAIHALVNSKDTPKDRLIQSIQILKGELGK